MSIINYKEELNSEQLEVVEKADGYSLVLAGAGSGKTRTITYRVAYILDKKLADSSEILLMTFTNKAAREMMERVENLLKTDLRIAGGTFHKMGNLFLRKYIHNLKYSSDFTILDQDDSQQLLNVCLSKLNLSIKKDNLPSLNTLYSLISYSKNTEEPLEYLLERYAYHYDIHEKILKLANLYEEEKQRLNQVDFDDLLILWLKILENNPELKERVSSKFKYILVDEYQDVNSIQAKIVKELSSVNQNLLVVGDDAQSIYSFRAANIQNILDFPKIYPNAKIFKLEKNYRSGEDILLLAQASILNNGEQYQKDLEAVNNEGERPLLVKVRDSKKQAEFIVKEILELRAEGINLKDIAILSRSMYLTIDIQLALSNYAIPYQLRGGQKYFEQAHIKDLLAFFKVIYNVKDELAWKRVLLMQEGIGAKTAEKIIDYLVKLEKFEDVFEENIKLNNKVAQSFTYLKNLFKDILAYKREDGTYNLQAMLNVIYKNFYIYYLKNTYDNFEERADSIEQLVDFLYSYNNLEKFLTDISLDEEAWNKEENHQDDKVILSTIHQAKGLEWKVVFIPNIYQGAFPHYKSLEKLSELEEERRLFYVAVTRAKEYLYFVFPQYSMQYNYGEVENELSYFLQEIDDNLYDERVFI